MGPGTALMKLLADLGLSPTEDCDCQEKMELMDAWGVAKCRFNRTTVIQWLRDGQVSWHWRGRLRHILQTAVGLTFKVNPVDPMPGLVDEALRRSAASQ